MWQHLKTRLNLLNPCNRHFNIFPLPSFIILAPPSVQGVCLACLSGRWSPSITCSQRFRPAASTRRGTLISASPLQGVSSSEARYSDEEVLIREESEKKPWRIWGSGFKNTKEMMLTVVCAHFGTESFLCFRRWGEKWAMSSDFLVKCWWMEMDFCTGNQINVFTLKLKCYS